MSRGFVDILKDNAAQAVGGAWDGRGSSNDGGSGGSSGWAKAAAAMVQQNKRCCRTLRIGA